MLQGHAEFDLSETGLRQAEMLYERFRAESFMPSAVYSSPQKRTARTAQIVTRDWAAGIEHWDDLKEHDIGVFSGMTWREIEQAFPEMAQAYAQWRNWDVVEGAEKIHQRQERGNRVVNTVLERHGNDDTVALFTHGGILQHIVAALMGTDRVWGVPVKNTAIFDFTLDLERWRKGEDRHHNFHWRIDRFNDATHLDGLRKGEVLEG
jgi:broad specificity phosphatase PhoE